MVAGTQSTGQTMQSSYSREPKNLFPTQKYRTALVRAGKEAGGEVLILKDCAADDSRLVDVSRMRECPAQLPGLQIGRAHV